MRKKLHTLPQWGTAHSWWNTHQLWREPYKIARIVLSSCYLNRKPWGALPHRGHFRGRGLPQPRRRTRHHRNSYSKLHHRWFPAQHGNTWSNHTQAFVCAFLLVALLALSVFALLRMRPHSKPLVFTPIFPIVFLARCFADTLKVATRVVFIGILPVVTAVTISTSQMLFRHCLCPRFPWE